MQFNLLETGYITTSGTISFDVESIEEILAVSGTVTISGSNNDDVWIYGDIVDRMGTYQIRYYFDSITSSGTVASGINFSYKNDAPDSYSSLTTNVGAGYYYTTVPSLSAPRYIRLNHTVSGTSINGTIVGLEVLNDDSIVDFGSDGSLTSSITETSLSYLNYNDYIKEIEIFNSGASTATAHVFIHPQYNDSDELLSISASESGPWVFARNIDYIISSADNWNAGQYDGTNTSGIADGKLRLDYNEVAGTYTTPIFKNESVKFAYIDMLQTSVSGAIVAVDSNDYTSTIQIRSNNNKPWDYNVYRRVYADTGNIYYKDFLLDSDTEVYNSYTETGQYFGTYTTTLHTNFTRVSDYSGKSCFIYAYVWKCASYSWCCRIYINLAYLDGGPMSNRNIYYNEYYNVGNTPTYPGLMVHFLEIGYNDDVWVYLSVENSYTNAGYDVPGPGYSLLHYSSSATRLYKDYLSSNFIAGCDVVKDTSGSLWYSQIIGTQAIVKISSTGTILLTYDNVTDPGRLCSTYDGGCWFIEEDSLYKLNSSGVLVDSITNLDIDDELTWVLRDESDANFLWIVDGVYIKLISLDGRTYKSIHLTGFTIVRMHSTTEGLVVYCTETSSGDEYLKYVGRASAGVDKTIANDGLTAGDFRGTNTVSYNNPTLGDIIPLSDDPVWNSGLEWNKAVTANAILPPEEYNQLRLTLRRPDLGVDSPAVGNIYYQDNVEIADIGPGQSKTLYLRISLPTGVTIGGDYESMLRVWWELPVI